MNCVLYARVSSKEQEKEGYSIPAQQKLLRKYSSDNGLTVLKEFIDVETAKRAGRAGFEEMLAFLRVQNECPTILVEKTDRLYRNIRDWVTLDEFDAEIHFVKENFILSKDSKSSEKFLHGIKVLMAKNYIDNLSEEVKKGLNEKASQGEWPARPPVGYRSNTETKLIEPDPEKGPLVKRLFELYASGQYSLAALSEKANESGLFSRNSTSINKAGIHRILKNPIYYGEFLWKGKRHFGKHKSVITKQLFDDVQTILKRPAQTTKTKIRFAYAGLVKCGKCGCSMTPEIKKGKYIYYHCTQYRGNCDNVYIREEKLGDLLGELLLHIRVGHQQMNDIKKALLESQHDKRQFHAEAVGTLQKRYKHIQKMLDRAYEDKLAGTISVALWERKSKAWEDELTDIRIHQRTYESANQNYYQKGVEILELANRAYDMYLGQSAEERRKLMGQLLSNCTFYRGSLYPTYRKPFDILAKGSSRILWRG